MRNFVFTYYGCFRSECRVIRGFGGFSVNIFTNVMTVIAVFLVLVGLVLWIRQLKDARKPKDERNKYIVEHEKKLKDDAVYDEYMEWCKFHGELPMEKAGFDELRQKEWKLEQKIRRSIK